jgi:hypothetical protein
MTPPVANNVSTWLVDATITGFPPRDPDDDDDEDEDAEGEPDEEPAVVRELDE